MSIIEEKKDSLREEFGFFDNPQDLFEYIIAKSKERPHLADEFKRDEFLVKGCVSSLWLVPSFDEKSGTCSFQSDADSLVTRGVAALVCDTCSGLTPGEILEFDPAFFEELGINAHLSPNRRNGLGQLNARIADYAKLKKAQVS